MQLENVQNVQNVLDVLDVLDVLNVLNVSAVTHTPQIVCMSRKRLSKDRVECLMKMENLLFQLGFFLLLPLGIKGCLMCLISISSYTDQIAK